MSPAWTSTPLLVGRAPRCRCDRPTKLSPSGTISKPSSGGAVGLRLIDAARPAHAGVGGVELADHLVGQVVKILVLADVLQQTLVALARRRPVDPVHVGVVEAVLHDPPRLVEDLPPLGLLVDDHGETRELDGFLPVLQVAAAQRHHHDGPVPPPPKPPRPPPPPAALAEEDHRAVGRRRDAAEAAGRPCDWARRPRARSRTMPDRARREPM